MKIHRKVTLKKSIENCRGWKLIYVKGKVKIGQRGLWLTHNKKDKKLICEHIQSVRQCHEADPETCQWFKNVQNALLDHIEEKT